MSLATPLPLDRLCRLALVSRAGFYRWRDASPVSDPDLDLRDEIQRIALEYPYYGWPRITAELEKRGIRVLTKKIIEGIENDEQSRKDWLDMRAQGLSLLGLKIEQSRGDVGTSSAPLEGQSTVRHPVLLEAVVAFQAGAMAELLPATGPVKVRSDMPPGAKPRTRVGPRLKLSVSGR